ncbi:MAG: hypothetical protein R2799_02885 [Crocinitomicaceae bacterium]
MKLRGIIFFVSVLTFLTGYNQESRKNEIEIDFGMFNFFFDQSPILNIKNVEKGTKINGIFSSSIGLQYNRKIGQNHYFFIGVNYINTYYPKFAKVEYINLLPTNGSRKWFNIIIGYAYGFSLGSKSTIKTGIGLLYRHGQELIIIDNISIGSPSNWNELLTETIFNRDLGAFINLKYQLNLSKLFYFHTALDFQSIFLFGNRYSVDRMRNGYNIKNYPTRFNLSWHFGFGVSF